MSEVSQSRRAIELGIDAEAYAELCKLRPSYVFSKFYDLREDVYLEQVARSMGARPAQNTRSGVEVVVLRSPALQP